MFSTAASDVARERFSTQDKNLMTLQRIFCFTFALLRLLLDFYAPSAQMPNSSATPTFPPERGSDCGLYFGVSERMRFAPTGMIYWARATALLFSSLC